MPEYAKLVWDQDAERYYETGVRNVVLYPKGSTGYEAGVAWNGVTGITQSPSGADENALWADDIKYLALRSAEEFGGTITAYTYPDEFAPCDGSLSPVAGVTFGQQRRKPFGLCYRTAVGNDVDFDEHAYKLHIIYNSTASPSDRDYATINNDPEAVEFSWEFSSTPVAVVGHETTYKPVAHIEIDSRTVNATKLAALEDILYGSTTAAARLPLPAELITLLTSGQG